MSQKKPNQKKNDLKQEIPLNKVSKSEYVHQMIHPAEAKLLEYLRKLEFGDVEIKVQNGLPVLMLRAIESRKLL